MKLIFMKEEVKGEIVDFELIEFTFRHIRITYVPNQKLIFTPVESYKDCLVPWKYLNEYWKEGLDVQTNDIQTIIDNMSDEILRGLIAYHKKRIEKYNEEYHNAIKVYDKVKEIYSKEMLFI